MASLNKHPLRRSCGFCRARKIKCSNETRCEACRKQNVDCIYESEPPKPTATRSFLQQLEAESITVTPERDSAPAAENGLHPAVGDQGDGADSEVLGLKLETMFAENFLQEHDEACPNPWQRKISGFHDMAIDTTTPPSTPPSGPGSHGANYGGVLSVLAQDLVALVVTKFGSLGTHSIDHGGGRMFIQGLMGDKTVTMFDPVVPGPSPLAEYGTRQVTQIIDIWFSTHPFSFLLSKTLFIHQLKSGTHDEALLAIILADANFFVGDEIANSRGQVLLRFATAQLYERSAHAAFSVADGTGPATRSAPVAISTAQSLTLLGLNSLNQSQYRRATCFFGMAGRVATELKNHKWSSASAGLGGHINGVDVTEVEKEVVAYLWWVTFTFTLWHFMQMDEKLPYLPGSSLSSIFLPVDATSSFLVKLDEASDNFSTLQKQKSTLRDMWPLAHEASLVAYIYALYPDEALPPDDDEAEGCWQENTMRALQRLHDTSVPQSLDLICKELHHVLMDNVRVLRDKVSHVPSRAIVIVLYHTIAIQLLFPRQPGRDLNKGSDSKPSLARTTQEVIDLFCASAEELNDIIAAVNEPSQPGLFAAPMGWQLHPSSTGMFSLALDTCTRALSHILSQGYQESSRKEVESSRPKLQSIAGRLLALAEGSLSPTASLKAVRGQLRTLYRSLSEGTMEARPAHGTPESRHPWMPKDHPAISSQQANSISIPAFPALEGDLEPFYFSMPYNTSSFGGGDGIHGHGIGQPNHSHLGGNKPHEQNDGSSAHMSDVLDMNPILALGDDTAMTFDFSTTYV
ncbi:hypothetical protein PG985_014965 [Apiospora marii]|uniref:Zn(2)-C6 fungal-type domain-containing protein n=1 Tax=Apiospora marii TaxID=335849 RepID=A0ABR1RIS0_9PEZI